MIFLSKNLIFCLSYCFLNEDLLVSIIFDMFECVWLTNSLTKSISILYMASIVAYSRVKDII